MRTDRYTINTYFSHGSSVDLGNSNVLKIFPLPNPVLGDNSGASDDLGSDVAPT